MSVYREITKPAPCAPPSPYTDMPPWVRYFLVQVVKRCAMILVKWIEDMQEEEKREN